MKLALSRSKEAKFGVAVLGARAMAATVATRRLAAILAADVGVRHVLAGSVRRTGNRVRVSAQLIDAATDAHLWAERFDGDTGDLFALQNEITGRLADALGVELIAAEALRPTEHPDALDYILRGRAVLLKPGTRDTHREAIHWFERALATSPPLRVSASRQRRCAARSADGGSRSRIRGGARIEPHFVYALNGLSLCKLHAGSMEE